MVPSVLVSPRGDQNGTDNKTTFHLEESQRRHRKGVQKMSNLSAQQEEKYQVWEATSKSGRDYPMGNTLCGSHWPIQDQIKET